MWIFLFSISFDPIVVILYIFFLECLICICSHNLPPITKLINFGANKDFFRRISTLTQCCLLLFFRYILISCIVFKYFLPRIHKNKIKANNNHCTGDAAAVSFKKFKSNPQFQTQLEFQRSTNNANNKFGKVKENCHYA